MNIFPKPQESNENQKIQVITKPENVRDFTPEETLKLFRLIEILIKADKQLKSNEKNNY